MSTPGAEAHVTPDWNGALGATWVAHADAIDAMFEGFGAHAIDALALANGESVLDIGCGAGATTLEIARRVGPGGRVLGVDLSAPLLELAADRAAAAGLANTRFAEDDAGTGDLGGPHDAVFSRFGVMFFPDPVAGFAHIGAAVRSGGRLAFACWQGREYNAWNSLPSSAAATVLPIPPASGPREPGGAMFAEPDYARAVLTRAGFTDVAFQPYATKLALPGGGDAISVAHEMAEILPSISAALRTADDSTRARAHDAIALAIVPHHDGKAIWLDAAVWIVSATKP